MKSISVYALLFLVLTLSSCNDWLDVKPKTEKDVNEMFDTEQGFKDALTACYIKMNSSDLYGLNLTMTNIEYMAQHWTFTNSSFDDVKLLKNFEYTSAYSEDLFSQVYGALYNVIAQANIMLENISTRGNVFENEDMRAMVEAEGLGIRAFCHMDVLRLFGQMPQNAGKQVSLAYVKTVSTASNPMIGFEEYVNLIMQDIDDALALLKDHDPVMKYSYKELDNFNNDDYDVELEDSYMGYRRFRINYYALRALKARLYMYLGNKSQAYTEAKSVIDALDRNGKKVISLAGREDFTEKDYALPSECLLALSNSNLEKTNQTYFELTLNKMDGLYLTVDQYTNNLFAGQATSTNNRAQYVWIKDVNNQGKEFMRFRKYSQPGKDDYTNTNMLLTRKQVIPLIRLSEMYLIAMECAPTLSVTNEFYLEYMKVRNVQAEPLSEGNVLSEIVNEYRREFFGEGQMFYTYKRLGMKKMLWKSDREVNENDYIVPLPSSEMK